MNLFAINEGGIRILVLYDKGEQPTILRKSVLKEPTLWNPTSKQTSVTDALWLNKSSFALIILLSVRYWWGVIPYTSLNNLIKWN